MSDNVSIEKRSLIMSKISSKRTSIENLVSSYLWKKGLRFRRNDATLYGKPDISVKKHRMVIFIDSCFWHGCPEHCRMPKSNSEYWTKKIQRNMERDTQVTAYYSQLGWHILRVWEHELKNKSLETMGEIEVFFVRSKSKDAGKKHSFKGI